MFLNLIIFTYRIVSLELLSILHCPAGISCRNGCNNLGGVEKVVLYPQTPQGGLNKLLNFSKSPLGDLGVQTRKRTFSTAPRDRQIGGFSFVASSTGRQSGGAIGFYRSCVPRSATDRT